MLTQDQPLTEEEANLILAAMIQAQLAGKEAVVDYLAGLAGNIPEARKALKSLEGHQHKPLSAFQDIEHLGSTPLQGDHDKVHHLRQQHRKGNSNRKMEGGQPNLLELFWEGSFGKPDNHKVKSLRNKHKK